MGYLTHTVGELERLTNIESLAMKGYIGIYYTCDTDFLCDYVAFAKKLNCVDNKLTIKEIVFYDSIRPCRKMEFDSIYRKILIRTRN